jgi:hypothetical protein
MATFISTESIVYPQAISAIDTTQNVPLGSIINARDNDASTNLGVGEFIYLLGVASTVVGSAVHYNADDFSTTLATANGKGPIAVAMGINVASSYGWYQISGKGSAKVLSGFADNADVYLTSTGGSFDDAVVSGDYVAKMKGASAISGGLADVEMSRPFTADALI